MPAVYKNTEKVSSPEMETPFKACISAIEKKLRNLEKRKGKLDAYRDKLAGGEKLDKDQKEAVAKYDTVMASLEFARELQKQFQTMSDEADKQAEKMSKKQAKREKLERQQQEIERLSEILKLQALLDNLGTEEVRADLQSGKYESVALTDDNLSHLDEFYQLIAPTTDAETSFAIQVASASDHLVSYLDRLDKPVVNTTYHDLHVLVDRISQSGFFDAAPADAAAAVDSTSAPTESAASDEAAAVAEEVDETFKTTEPAESQPEETEAASTEAVSGMMTKSDVGDHQFEMVSVSESVVEAPTSLQSSALGMTWYQQASVAATVNATAASSAPAGTQTRPIQDIVSCLQGSSYNFLQDSEIDVEQSYERMNFGVSQDSSYGFMAPQQMVAQPAVDLHHYPATVAAPTTYPNGGYVAHHQVAMQEPGYVVVGHDPASGEVQLAYGAAGQPAGYMAPMMSGTTASNVAAVQQPTVAGVMAPSSKSVAQPLDSMAKLGAGDTTDHMTPVSGQQNALVPPVGPQSRSDLPSADQGFGNSSAQNYSAASQGYAARVAGAGGRGFVGDAGPRGASRGGAYAGNMNSGGRGSTAYRGGKPR